MKIRNLTIDEILEPPKEEEEDRPLSAGDAPHSAKTLLEEAVISDKGIAVECVDVTAALRLVGAMHKYRQTDRAANLKANGHAASEFDNLTIMRDGSTINVLKSLPVKVKHL